MKLRIGSISSCFEKTEILNSLTQYLDQSIQFQFQSLNKVWKKLSKDFKVEKFRSKLQ